MKSGKVKMKNTLELTLVLAKADFKERNEGSYLGIVWYMLNPLLMFLLLLLIFFDRIGHCIPHYPLYLLLGIIIFNSFHKITVEATQAIYANRWIIKSINFPKIALISSVVMKGFFSHIFEFVLFLLFSLFFRASIAGAVFYPFILLFFYIFVFGMSLFLASMAVYFIDIEFIWGFLARLIWFGTPIFYAIAGQKRLFILNLFNPMYYYITIARKLMIYAEFPEWWMVAGAIGYSFLALFIGLVVFGRLKHKFAELI